jgi:hypothetical protein
MNATTIHPLTPREALSAIALLEDAISVFGGTVARQGLAVAEHLAAALERHKNGSLSSAQRAELAQAAQEAEDACLSLAGHLARRKALEDLQGELQSMAQMARGVRGMFVA